MHHKAECIPSPHILHNPNVLLPGSSVACRQHAGAFLTVPIILIGPGPVKLLKMKAGNQQIPLPVCAETKGKTRGFHGTRRHVTPAI